MANVREGVFQKFSRVIFGKYEHFLFQFLQEYNWCTLRSVRGAYAQVTPNIGYSCVVRYDPLSTINFM